MTENEMAQQDRIDLYAWPFCSKPGLVGQSIADRALALGTEQAFAPSIF
jgi:hypothetical protein